MNPVESPEIVRARRLDDICNRFEAAWRAAGSHGTIPDWQDFVDQSSHDAELQSELLEIDQHYRRRLKHGDETQTLNDEPHSDASDTIVLPDGFSMLGVLARGGMGVVYRARQPLLQRDVAIKFIRDAALATSQQRMRFLAEAEAIAALSHPGIVQVYQFGTANGSPYLALEYCPGGTLADKLAHGSLPPRAAAEMVERVARAVQAAHDCGIIHRDLKPANILLTHDGLPKVTDFGLARRADGVGLTVTGEVLGTPAYMSPEQASGKKAGPTTDVYSLGAILYECLSGKPPFTGANAGEIITRVIRDELVSVSRHLPTLPRDLATICHRCLAKQPEERLQSPGALAEDLRAFLDGRPIRARRVSGLERLVKWSKRYPVVAGMTLAITLLLIAGSVISTFFALRSRQEARDAEKARDEAKEQARAARASAVRMYRDRGFLAYQSSNPGEGLLWHAHALAHLPDDADEQRAELLHHTGAWTNHALSLVHVFQQPGRVTALAFNSDGTRAAIGGDYPSIQTFDTETGAQIGKSLECKEDARVLAFTPDNRYLVATYRSHTVRVWDLQTSTIIGSFDKAPWAGMGLAVHPDGKSMVIGGGNREAAAFRLPTCEPIGPAFELMPADVNSASFHPDGTCFALGINNGVIHVYEWPSGKLARAPIRVDNAPLPGIAFSRDGHRIAVAGWQGHASVWDWTSGTNLWTSKRSSSLLNSVAALPGPRFVFGSGDGRAEIAELDGRFWPMPLQHLGPVRCVATDPGGRWILTGSEDGFARLWRTRKLILQESSIFEGAQTAAYGTRRLLIGGPAGARLVNPDGPQFAKRVSIAALGPDDQTALTGHADKTYQFWNAKTGEPLTPTVDVGFVPRFALFSPDGKRALIWTQTNGGYFVLLDPASGQRIADLRTVGHKTHTHGAIVATFSRDSQFINVSGAMDIYILYRASDGARQSKTINSGAFGYASSAGPSTAAVGTSANEVRIFDQQTGRQFESILMHPGMVYGVEYSPDGRTLLAGCKDGSVRQWDTATGTLIGRPWVAHQSPVGRVAYHPNQPLALSVDADGGLRFWDSRTGRPIGPPLVHRQRAFRTDHQIAPLSVARFSPSGDEVLTVVGNQVRLIPIPKPWPDDAERLREWIAVNFGLVVSPTEEAVQLTPSEWYARWRQSR